MEEEWAKSGVAWRWVIEALASSDLVDLPLLYELLLGGGEHLGTAAMEATALRCLEALSQHVQQQQQEEEDEHTKMRFNKSDTCQHVLHCIMRQTSNLQKHFNSSIHTFVNHKKATTNNTSCCTLELLKNLIQQGDTAFLNQIQNQGDNHPTDNLGPPPKKLKLQQSKTPAAGDSSQNNVAGQPKSDYVAPNKPIFSSTQDSLTLTDDTDPNLCIKCNQGGQLLECHATTCPLLFHQTCLGCAASFDDQANFYCPICAYSRAVSEYARAKQKLSLARKDLTFFIGGGV